MSKIEPLFSGSDYGAHALAHGSYGLNLSAQPVGFDLAGTIISPILACVDADQIHFSMGIKRYHKDILWFKYLCPLEGQLAMFMQHY